MIRVTFVEVSGSRHTVDVSGPQSLMQAAVWNSVPGILAECGGACSCATCHVRVSGEWMKRLPPRTALESAMLEGALDPSESSRLACQIELNDSLDGLEVQLPERQI